MIHENQALSYHGIIQFINHSSIVVGTSVTLNMIRIDSIFDTSLHCCLYVNQPHGLRSASLLHVILLNLYIEAAFCGGLIREVPLSEVRSNLQLWTLKIRTPLYNQDSWLQSQYNIIVYK